MKVLVLGGAGFIGRHASAAVARRGHEVIIGTRRPRRAARRLPAALHGCERRGAHLHRLLTPEAWSSLLEGVDVVINAVGILRERGAETYERIHHLAPAALATACARRAIHLIHVSALGLRPDAKSRFLRSKLSGELAIGRCNSGTTIVRPSLLDGEGGYGASWFRRLARWPVHFLPAGARGRIAALQVTDLGDAIAALCGKKDIREVELGGGRLFTFREYLRALRPAHLGTAFECTVPSWLARSGSHACDLVHFSPFSYGHLELMSRDNAPRHNALPALLGHAPAPIGARPRTPALSLPLRVA